MVGAAPVAAVAFANGRYRPLMVAAH